MKKSEVLVEGKTMKNEIPTKAGKIAIRMYRRRLDGDSMQNWTWIEAKEAYAKAKESGITIEQHIEKILESGKRVTAGYLCTKVRGYHEHYLLVKDKKVLDFIFSL